MKKLFALALAAALVLALGASALAAVPAELSTAFQVGTWPLAAGAYDPALDGQGITNGTAVYGLFDANYATLPNPTSVTGYTQGSSPAALKDGEWFLLTGSSGFNYVLVKGGDATITGGVGNTTVDNKGSQGTPPAKTGDEMNIVVWTAVGLAAAAGIVVIARRRNRAED